MRSGLVTGETRTGDVGGPGILGLDAQGGPLARLGVDIGEGREFVHGGGERSQRSHIGKGRRGHRSIGLFRLEGVSGFHVNVFKLEVLVKAGGRRPGARGFHGREEFVKWQLNRWADDVKLVGIV